MYIKCAKCNLSKNQEEYAMKNEQSHYIFCRRCRRTYEHENPLKDIPVKYATDQQPHLKEIEYLIERTGFNVVNYDEDIIKDVRNYDDEVIDNYILSKVAMVHNDDAIGVPEVIVGYKDRLAIIRVRRLEVITNFFDFIKCQSPCECLICYEIQNAVSICMRCKKEVCVRCYFRSIAKTMDCPFCRYNFLESIAMKAVESGYFLQDVLSALMIVDGIQ
jgi:hypothetical protein